jgi:hypothetical protein
MFRNYSRQSAKSAGLAAFLTAVLFLALPVGQCIFTGNPRAKELPKISKNLFHSRIVINSQ